MKNAYSGLPYTLLLLISACTNGGTAGDTSESEIAAGPLTRVATIPVHERPSYITMVDVNGDGNLDLVVGGTSLSVLVGDGELQFQQAPGTPIDGFEEAVGFRTGEFDGDGRVDIAFAEHDAPAPRFWVLRGTEQGGFAPAPNTPVIVDARPHLHTLAVGDFNSDGLDDVVTDSWPESSLVFVAGNKDGSFAVPGIKFKVPEAPLQNLQAADMNSDGIPDIVVPAHDFEAVTVLLCDGKGTFHLAPGAPYRSHGGFSTLEIADVDRDGDSDVVVVHRSDQSTQYKIDALSVLLNDGSGVLEHGPGSPLVDLPRRSVELAVGDLNGDGWPDVTILGETNGEIAIFHGAANGFTAAGVTRPGARLRGLAVGDLDGDGRAEVVVSDFDGSRLIVLSEKQSQ